MYVYIKTNHPRCLPGSMLHIEGDGEDGRPRTWVISMGAAPAMAAMEVPRWKPPILGMRNSSIFTIFHR